MRNGLLPGRNGFKRGRQAVFFTTVNPMEVGYGLVETPFDLTKPRTMPYMKTWNGFLNAVFWCNLELVQERGLQFYQTRSHAVVLYDTLAVACIERAVCMKTTDELCQKVCLTPRAPRVVLKLNSQHGLQDPQNQGARSSWEPSRDLNSYGEACNRTVDHRTAGVPLSAVEPRNTTRENKVERLIEKSENHQNKNSLIQDLRQTEKINKFTQESQDFIADMNNTEIFELCENFLPNSNVLTAMPTGKSDNLLQLWQKYDVYAKFNGLRPEQQ